MKFLKKNFAVGASRKVTQKSFAKLVNFIDVPPYLKFHGKKTAKTTKLFFIETFMVYGMYVYTYSYQCIIHNFMHVYIIIHNIIHNRST